MAVSMNSSLTRLKTWEKGHVGTPVPLSWSVIDVNNSSTVDIKLTPGGSS
jgi:hypothetical protein